MVSFICHCQQTTPAARVGCDPQVNVPRAAQNIGFNRNVTDASEKVLTLSNHLLGADAFILTVDLIFYFFFSLLSVHPVIKHLISSFPLPLRKHHYSTLCRNLNVWWWQRSDFPFTQIQMNEEERCGCGSAYIIYFLLLHRRVCPCVCVCVCMRKGGLYVGMLIHHPFYWPVIKHWKISYQIKRCVNDELQEVFFIKHSHCFLFIKILLLIIK